MDETWYRYENVCYSSLSDWEYHGQTWTREEILLRKFKVLKHTPKGVWIDEFGRDKFILKDAKKRYACPTISEAKVSFLARKAKQLKILEGQIKRVKEAIAKGEKLAIH